MTTVVQEKEKTKRVLFSYTWMFFLGTALVLSAVITALLFNRYYPLSQLAIKMLEYLGYVGWAATLGMRGWDIQTWDGNTFPERLNDWLAKSFSIIGIFSFVLARELIPAV